MQKLKNLPMILILTTIFVMVVNPSPNVLASSGAVAPNLGAAASFVALASSTLTNAHAGVFVGDIGVSPGMSIIGFPPGIVKKGTIYAGGPVAAQAHIDASNAYIDLAKQMCNVDLTGKNLGGMTLTPGVYCYDKSAQLTGKLVLNARGDPLAVWILQIGSMLTTASGSSMSVINSGQAINVFWQVGSSATLGTGTWFDGNILAVDDITLEAGTILIGRALALNGAVFRNTDDTPFPIANSMYIEFFFKPFIIR